MVAQLESQPSLDDHIQKTKTLICALNLVSRNLPLPPDVFHTVSSIYRGEDDGTDGYQGGGAAQSTCDEASVRVPSMSFILWFIGEEWIGFSWVLICCVLLQNVSLVVFWVVSGSNFHAFVENLRILAVFLLS